MVLKRESKKYNNHDLQFRGNFKAVLMKYYINSVNRIAMSSLYFLTRLSDIFYS